MEWRKVLYDRQGCPDDYVPPDSFLKELRKNGQSPCNVVE